MKSKWLNVKYTPVPTYRSTESQPAAVAQSAKSSIRDPARAVLDRLVARFDRSVFDVGRPLVRIRVENGAEHDVVIDDGNRLPGAASRHA